MTTLVQLIRKTDVTAAGKSTRRFNNNINACSCHLFSVVRCTCFKTGFLLSPLTRGLFSRRIASSTGTMVHSIRPLVLCGPSGSGKSSLLKLLFEEFPDKFGFSVSHTTRSPRPGEVDGQHYHFTTRDEMKAAIERGEFIESATFSNNMYGTSKAAVAAVQSAGKTCVLDIEVEGVKQVKLTDLNPLFVFIKPPSLEELEKRLRNRNTETEESLQRRLTTARSELAYAEIPGNFDLVLVNDNLEKAYIRLRDFILKEMNKSSNSSDLWCCLGSTSKDHTSDDYYYMSTNISNANPIGLASSDENPVVFNDSYRSDTIDQPSAGDISGEGCGVIDSSGANDTSAGCFDSGGANDSSAGCCDSGGSGGGDCGGSYD